MKTHREQFLEDASDFIDWLTESLTQQPGFQHAWQSRGGLNKTGVIRGETWSCSSIFDAYDKYVWPSHLVKYRKMGWTGRSFEENEQCLSTLQERLISIADGINDSDALIRCREVFEWGGVDDRKNVARDIKIGMTASQIKTHLTETRQFINSVVSSGNIPANIAFNDSNGFEIRIDSGTTKIYSLICDDFVIYDSRVAAALSYLVVLWWRERKTGRQEHINYNRIPSTLRFSHGGRYRNPNPIDDNGNRIHIFSSLVPGDRRFRENIRSSWLLKEVLRRDNIKKRLGSKFSKIKPYSKRLRALESALFMIGYDVSGAQYPNKNSSDHMSQQKTEKTNKSTSLHPHPENKEGHKNNNMNYYKKLREKLSTITDSETIQMQGGTFEICPVFHEGALIGINTTNLGAVPFLPMEVFAITISLLILSQEGKAPKGDAMNNRLGDPGLPLNSVEGHIASIIYGKSIGDTVTRRITPVSRILEWAEICVSRNGTLSLLQI